MHNVFTWGKTVVCSVFLLVLLWSVPGVAQGQLISADYGTGDNRVDVTNRIQSLVRNGYLNVRVNNDSMAVSDPARGRTKELRLRVREGNRIRDYNFRENTVANVALNVGESGGFGGRGRDRDYDGDDDNYNAAVVILQAWYGGGDHVMNVTQRLRSLMVNGGINVRVNNQTMATDPAPDQRKALFVL
jgi:hypothetical protein